MPLQSVYYELSDPGLKPLSGLTEIYIPLWVHSIGTVSTTSVTTPMFIQKGSTGVNSSAAVSAAQLLKLGSNWPTSQKFALEASIYSSVSTATANVALYQGAAIGIVTGSSISTTSTTATIIRSSSFTLTPNTSFQLLIRLTAGSGTAYLTKAHLVALMQ